MALPTNSELRRSTRISGNQEQSATEVPQPDHHTIETGQESTSEKLERTRLENEIQKELRERRREHQAQIQVLNKCNITKFEGGDNIEPWLRNLDHFMKLNQDVIDNISEQEKVTFIKTLLTEKVQSLLDRDQSLNSVTRLVEKLRTTYCDKVDYKRKLHNIAQESNETATDFLARIRFILNKTDNLDAPMNKAQLDDRTLQIFWYKSLPDIERSLTLRNPVTIEDALQHSLVVEDQRPKHQSCEHPHKKQKVKFDDQSEEILTHMNEKQPQEPYKNDINTRFKQINEKLNNAAQKNLESINVMKDEIITSLKSEILTSIKETGSQYHNNNRNPQRYREPQYKRQFNPQTTRRSPYPYHKPQFNRSNNNTSATCHYCKIPGHLFKQCRRATEQQKQELQEHLNSQRDSLSSQMRRRDTSY